MKHTVTTALELEDKEIIEELEGTVSAIYDPEPARGGPYKGKEVQNLYLSEGGDKLKVVLSAPAIFQDTSIRGKRISFKCTPGAGGQAAGKMFGVSKSLFNGYHEVRCTPKCQISIDSAPAQVYSNGSRSNKVSSKTSQAVPIPLKVYVQDFIEVYNECQPLLVDAGLGDPQVARDVIGACYMSWLNQNKLVKLDYEKAMAENWEEYTHPKSGLTLPAMNEKNHEKFLDQVIIPAISGSDDSVPIKVIRKACKGLDIGVTEIAERWCHLNDVSEKALADFLTAKHGDSPSPEHYIEAIKQDLLPAIKAFEPQDEALDTETEDNEDW